MADTIEKVQVEVEATAKGVSTVFKQLESQLGTIQKAMASIDTSKLNAVAKNINTSGMSKAERDISSSVDKIKQSLAGLKSYKDAALGGDSSSLTSLQRRIVSIQSAIDVLSEKLKQVGDNRTGINIDTEQFQEYRRQLAELQAMLEQTKDEAKNAAEEMSKEKPDVDTKSISEKLSGIKEKAISALKAIKKVASGIGSAFVSAGKGLKSIAARMLGVSGGLGKTSSSFKHGLRTLIKYGFGVRSLYVLFRRLRKAITESFTELQKSGAMWQTTKANVEGLKTALSTLKFQFGAAFEPLFNVVAPALTSFINYLISLMNTISAFIAKLTGRSTYSKVAQVMNNTASSAGSAGKATKELNKQLQAFDELNNISPENNSGGSGGSGGGGTGTSATYTEESVDSALGDFANSLAEAIEKGDWYKVGNLISQKLTDAMNSIDWDKVFAGAANFGKNLADFLNGLITPDLFDALGTTIGNAIKTKLTFLNEFAKELDWSNLGASVASGLKAFVDTHPLVLMAETFSNWAVGITGALATAITNALNNGTIETISNDILEAIKKIDVKDVAWNVGTIVSGLANSIYILVSKKDTWKELGTKISDGINNFFKSMGETDLVTGMNGFEALGASSSSLSSGILNMIITAVEKVDWKKVGKAISDFIKGIDFKQLAVDLSNLTGSLLEALTNAVAGVDWSEVGQAIADFIKGIDFTKVIWNLAKLAWEVVKGLASALTSLLTDGEALAKIGEAIVAIIAVSKLTGLGASLGTSIASFFQSNTVTWPSWAKIVVAIGAGIIAWQIGTEIGDSLGRKLAEAAGDEETASYYGRSAKENAEDLADAAENGNLVDGVDRMLGSWLSNGTPYQKSKSTPNFVRNSDGSVRYAYNSGQGPYGDADGNFGEERFSTQAINFGLRIASTLNFLKSLLMKKITSFVSETVATVESGKTILSITWNKFFSIEDDVKKMVEKNWEFFKSEYDSMVDKIKRYIVQEKTGIQLQSNVTYEYDENGGIRYAYKSNKDNNQIVSKYKFYFEALYNKGFISKKDLEQFTEDIEKFKKFANKSGINIKSKFDMLGDIDSIEDLKKFMQMMNVVNDFSGVYESQYNIDVGGDVDNTDDIDKLGGSMNNLRKGWNGKDAKMTVNTSVSGYGNGIQGLSTLANDFKTKLFDKWQGRDAKMTTSYDTTRNSKALSDLDALGKEWSKKSASANFTVTTENMSGWQSWSSYRALCDLYNNWYGTDAKFGVQFDVSGAPNIQKAFRDLTADINAKLNAAGVPGTVSVPNIQTATGGVVTSAQLRMVGEAGAEAIVPLQNNLGWLGKMSDMLVSGMEQSSTLGSFVSPPNTRFATYESTGYGSNSSDYLLTELVRETARQNDILEQILDKPSGITSSEVFRAVRTEGRSFKTRTGNSPFNY